MFVYQSIGMIRSVDKMGRVVIPKSMRTYLNMEDDKDKFEITLRGREIILRKFEPCCIFCGETNTSVKMCDMQVCSACIERLRLLDENKPKE